MAEGQICGEVQPLVVILPGQSYDCVSIGHGRSRLRNRSRSRIVCVYGNIHLQVEVLRRSPAKCGAVEIRLVVSHCAKWAPEVLIFHSYYIIGAKHPQDGQYSKLVVDCVVCVSVKQHIIEIDLLTSLGNGKTEIEDAHRYCVAILHAHSIIDIEEAWREIEFDYADVVRHLKYEGQFCLDRQELASLAHFHHNRTRNNISLA